MNAIFRSRALIFLGWLITATVHAQTPQVRAPSGTKPPPPPPPAPNPTEMSSSFRISSASLKSKPTTEYDGALLRIRQRALRAAAAQESAEEMARRTDANVSYDSMTGKPQGIYFFLIKY